LSRLWSGLVRRRHAQRCERESDLRSAPLGILHNAASGGVECARFSAHKSGHPFAAMDCIAAAHPAIIDASRPTIESALLARPVVPKRGAHDFLTHIAVHPYRRVAGLPDFVRMPVCDVDAKLRMARCGGVAILPAADGSRPVLSGCRGRTWATSGRRTLSCHAIAVSRTSPPLDKACRPRRSDTAALYFSRSNRVCFAAPVLDADPSSRAVYRRSME
jgi:hypothetical protein